MLKISGTNILFDCDNMRLIVNENEVKLDYTIGCLLRYFLDNPYQPLSRSQLIQNVWKSTHVSDDAINRGISVLRKALGGGQQEFIKTVPKVGYQFTCSVESVSLTNDIPGLARTEHHLIHNNGAASKKLYMLSGALMTMALLFISAFAIDLIDANRQLIPMPNIEAHSTPIQSVGVAVLPFRDVNSSKDLQYLSEGLAEGLINSLGTVSSLKVTSRTSSFFLGKRDSKIEEVAEALDVRFVIKGNFRFTDNHIDLSARIYDVKNEEYLWQKDYEVELEGLPKLNKTLFMDVFKAVASQSDTDRDKSQLLMDTDRALAHNEYLLGRFHFEKLTNKGLKQAIVHFTKAIEIDPDYPLAWAELGTTYHYLSRELLGSMEPEKAMELGQNAIVRSFELSPEHYATKSALAFNYYRQGMAEQAATILRQVIKNNPNYGRAYHWLHIITSHPSKALSHPDVAFETLMKSTKIDPFSLVNNANLSHEYLARGLFERADSTIARMKFAQSDSWITHHATTEKLMHEGKYAEVVRSFREHNPELNKYNRYNYAQALLSLGLNEEANQLYTDGPVKHSNYFLQAFAIERIDAVPLGGSSKNSERLVALSAYKAINQGDYDTALNKYTSLDACGTENSHMLLCVLMGYAAHKTGKHLQAEKHFDRARRMLGSLEAGGIKYADNQPVEYLRALLMIFEGKPEQVMATLIKLTEQGYLPFYINDPIFDELHQQPNWLDLKLAMEKVKNSQRSLLSTQQG